MYVIYDADTKRAKISKASEKDYYSGRVLFRMEPELHKKLNLVAIQNDMSMNCLLNTIVTEALENEKWMQ